MEDNKKNSFYDFLLANSELTTKPVEKPQTKKYHIVLSWIVVFFSNILILWLGWNYAVSPVFKLPLLSFVQSTFLYAVTKVLTRGFFSVQ